MRIEIHKNWMGFKALPKHNIYEFNILNLNYGDANR